MSTGTLQAKGVQSLGGACFIPSTCLQLDHLSFLPSLSPFLPPALSSVIPSLTDYFPLLLFSLPLSMFTLSSNSSSLLSSPLVKINMYCAGRETLTSYLYTQGSLQSLSAPTYFFLCPEYITEYLCFEMINFVRCIITCFFYPLLGIEL